MTTNKVRSRDLTPEQRKQRNKRSWLITGLVILIIAAVIGVFFLVGLIGAKANINMVSEKDAIKCRLTPEIDTETGYWTFVTDEEFKVLQLTDIHIGAGTLSIKKDNWALNAVETLIRNEKPDLVIVTGDIAYPVPFQAGTFNNKREAQLFATLMDKLEVYWAFAFGNHDTEVYSYYSREDISKFYLENNYKYLLYQEGDKDVDGCGNYIVNVKNTKGLITQSFVMVDSHSYTDGDYFGTEWKYDNIHQNQIDWYEREIKRLNDKNKIVFSQLSSENKQAYANLLNTTVESFETDGMIKSSLFFHIPLVEYRDAWEDYMNNEYRDTTDTIYNFGVAGETGKIVYSGIGEDELFEKALELGSTKNFFCGHDHFNNFSLTYKGITLTYGMSIDYLAYLGIAKKTEQRGGTLITINIDGSVELAQRRLSDYNN